MVVVGFLLLQQIIMASSTVWIVRLIEEIQEGNFSYILLSLYLISLLLPYIPGAGAEFQLERAKIKANLHFVDLFVKTHKGEVIEWTNTAHHSSKSTIMTSEAPQTINNYIDYLYYFASYGISSAINILVIAIIVEPLLLVTYVTGLLLAFLILKLQSKRKKISSLKAQQGRMKWISMLLKAWDNILLNNDYNLTMWRHKMDQRGKRLMGSRVRLESLTQVVRISMAFALLAPSCLLIVSLPYLYKDNLTHLAMMVVALPRLFQILSYSYDLLYQLADYPMQKGYLNTVLKHLNILSHTVGENSSDALSNRIKWDKIQLTSNENEVQLKSFLNQLPATGRYTIKGENGSGKTALLLHLKMLNGENAFFLPVKHDLVFKRSSTASSTGQLAQKTLAEIFHRLNAPIVLLDEWDANLDTFNQGELSKLIDQLALKKCVIEVRH